MRTIMQDSWINEVGAILTAGEQSSRESCGALGQASAEHQSGIASNLVAVGQQKRGGACYRQSSRRWLIILVPCGTLPVLPFDSQIGFMPRAAAGSISLARLSTTMATELAGLPSLARIAEKNAALPFCTPRLFLQN